MKRAGEVDRDDRVPTFDREVLDLGDVLDAGVVHEDVDAAELRCGELHHVLDLAGFAHVGTVVLGANTERFDLGLGCFGIAEAVEHDVCALLGESLGNGEANAAGGPRDKRGFAFEHEDQSPDELGCNETIIRTTTSPFS
jgi:hypothetical protein